MEDASLSILKAFGGYLISVLPSSEFEGERSEEDCELGRVDAAATSFRSSGRVDDVFVKETPASMLSESKARASAGVAFDSFIVQPSG